MKSSSSSNVHTSNKQILSYCACILGFSLISSAFNFYYVKVFLNFYHIEQSWFQLAQILFLIWNAINDPLFAYCQDNYQTRFTRTRRESVLYGAPFFALSFLTPWFSWGTSPIIIGLHLIIALCFWDTMFTFIGLAMCCLFTEISHDESDRFKLTRYSQVASLLGSCSPLILEHTSKSLQNFPAFQITCVCIATLAWLMMRYCGMHCHTKYDMNQMKSNKQQTLDHGKAPNESYWRQTWQILSDRDFVSFVTTNFFQEFHRTFLSNFMAIICDQLIPTELVPLWIRSSFYGSTSMASQILLVLFMPVIAQYPYFKVIRLGFVWKIASGFIMFMTGQSQPWFLMVFLLLDSCFTGASFSLFNLPLSDIADNNMQRYNRKHPISSMVFGTNALFVKPAISLSPMLVVSILNSYGYDKINKQNSTTDLTNQEMDSLRNAMFLLVCFYPIIIGFIQFCCWSFYTIRDKKSAVVIYVEGQES